MALRLEDIELIKRLKGKYFRSIDTCDIPALEEMFTPEATVCYVGGTYRWEANSRAEIIAGLKASFHPRFVSIHNGHSPEIDVYDDDTADGIWYLTDWSLNLDDKVATHGASIYRDKYVKVGGAWKIKRATYTRVYEQVDHLKELPNITAHYLGGMLKPGPA
jgi:hypothetical protein